MQITTLRTHEDLVWLADTHGIPIVGVKLALLYGNESSPKKIETFTEDHYKCKPTTYTWQDRCSGSYVKQGN